jgi:hypothetical protein
MSVLFPEADMLIVGIKCLHKGNSQSCENVGAGSTLTPHEYIPNVGFRSHFCAKQSLIRVP